MATSKKPTAKASASISASPLATVRDKFKDKKSLVEAVTKLASKDLWIDADNKSRGIEGMSNKQLLKLHAVLEDVKTKFGTRSGLIDKVLEKQNRSKDGDYRTKLEKFSTPRLVDTLRAGA